MRLCALQKAPHSCSSGRGPAGFPAPNLLRVQSPQHLGANSGFPIPSTAWGQLGVCAKVVELRFVIFLLALDAPQLYRAGAGYGVTSSVMHLSILCEPGVGLGCNSPIPTRTSHCHTQTCTGTAPTSLSSVIAV